MRGPFILVLSTALLTAATPLAQTTSPDSDVAHNPAANSAATKSVSPSRAQPQPQGHTGPTTTTSGGAPATSPQGDTPAGMQPQPNDPNQDGEKK
jgi:hypothetical protein